MEKVKVYFLHGFLGVPQDWEFIQSSLANQVSFEGFAVDYLNSPSFGPQKNFQQWAANFNKYVRDNRSGQEKNILVGYSMGGRLALHSMEESPSLWDQVILISTNLGIKDSSQGVEVISEERRQRLLQDELWAEQFLKVPWSEVIQKWNSQSVFGASQLEPKRLEGDYDKKLLAMSMVQWSLAKQKDFREFSRKFSDRMTWFVGDLDSKYLELINEFKANHSEIKIEIVPKSGHRVIFDNPYFVGQRLADVIRKSLAKN